MPLLTGAAAVPVQALLNLWSERGGAAFDLLAHGHTVDWSTIDHAGDVWTDEGSIRSPVADQLGLAEPVATLRFLFVRARPGGAGELPPTRAIALQLAATGATEYEPRKGTVALPLLRHGVASVIIMAPWYGTRAPTSQRGAYVETVADYLRQSLTIITEGAALLRWLGDGFRVDDAEVYCEGRSLGRQQREEGAVPIKVAATGFSWGEQRALISLLEPCVVASYGLQLVLLACFHRCVMLLLLHTIGPFARWCNGGLRCGGLGASGRMHPMLRLGLARRHGYGFHAMAARLVHPES